MGHKERGFFLKKAREADEMAASVKDDNDRSVWEQIAEEYRKLAEAARSVKDRR